MSEVFDALLEKATDLLTGKQLKELYTCPEKDLILYHHSLGRFLRNNLNLWYEGNPFPGKHPDDLSQELIVAMWKKGQK